MCVPEAGHGAVDQEAGQHGGQAVPGEAVAPQVGAQHRAVVCEQKHTSTFFRKSQESKLDPRQVCHFNSDPPVDFKVVVFLDSHLNKRLVSVTFTEDMNQWCSSSRRRRRRIMSSGAV